MKGQAGIQVNERFWTPIRMAGWITADSEGEDPLGVSGFILLSRG